jgi:type IV secretion system protein VirB6
VLAAALLLQIVESYAVKTAALGSAVVTVDALDMVLVAVLVFLLMRQVMPIAAALAGGMALSTFGGVGRLVGWGLRQGQSLGRGAMALGAAGLRGRPAEPVSTTSSGGTNWRDETGGWQ